MTYVMPGLKSSTGNLPVGQFLVFSRLTSWVTYLAHGGYPRELNTNYLTRKRMICIVSVFWATLSKGWNSFLRKEGY